MTDQIDPASGDAPADDKVAGATPPQDNSSEEDKAFARRLGWRPQEEWADAPDGRKPRSFLGAKDFIDKINNDLPVLRERLRTQDSTIVNLGKKIDELGNRVGDQSNVIKQLHESNVTARQRGYEAAKRELRDQMASAADQGDGQAFREAQGRLDALETEQAAEKEKTGNGADHAPASAAPPSSDGKIPEVEAWLPDNQWFQDIELNGWAVAREVKLQKEMPNSTLTQRLERLSKDAEAKFGSDYPELFPNYKPPSKPNPRRQSASSVSTPSGGSSKPAELTYESLPQEAKDTCDELCRTIKGFTREKYLKEYRQ